MEEKRVENLFSLIGASALLMAFLCLFAFIISRSLHTGEEYYNLQEKVEKADSVLAIHEAAMKALFRNDSLFVLAFTGHDQRISQVESAQLSKGK